MSQVTLKLVAEMRDLRSVLRLQRWLILVMPAIGAAVGVATVARQYADVRDITQMALATGSPRPNALVVASMAPEYFLAISPSRWVEGPAIIMGASIVGAAMAAVIGGRLAEGYAVKSDAYMLVRTGRGRWVLVSALASALATLASVAALALAGWISCTVATAMLDSRLEGAADLIRSAHQVPPSTLLLAWLAACVPAALAFACACVCRSSAVGALATSGFWLVQIVAVGHLPAELAQWMPITLQTHMLRTAIPDALPITVVSLVDVPGLGFGIAGCIAILAGCILATYAASWVVLKSRDI